MQPIPDPTCWCLSNLCVHCMNYKVEMTRKRIEQYQQDDDMKSGHMKDLQNLPLYEKLLALAQAFAETLQEPSSKRVCR